MRVVFHPRVFSEVDAIMRYYEDVAGPQLADDFYDEFASSFSMHHNIRIDTAPEKAD